MDESALHFYVDVVDERGTVVNWKFEGYGIGPAIPERLEA